MEGAYTFPGIAPLYPGYVTIMLNVKQGIIKYHFGSLWCDRRPVSYATGEHELSNKMFLSTCITIFRMTESKLYVYFKIMLFFFLFFVFFHVVIDKYYMELFFFIVLFLLISDFCSRKLVFFFA